MFCVFDYAVDTQLQKVNLPFLPRISLNLNQKPVASDADEVVA
jgi:hypothetical protein